MSRPLVELVPDNSAANRVCTCVVHEGLLLLVERRHGGWTLPGGGVRRGESRRRAAARETLEESGVLVEPAARGVTVTGTTGRSSSCFSAIRLDQVPSPEGRTVRWVDPGEQPWRDDPQIEQLRCAGLFPASLF